MLEFKTTKDLKISKKIIDQVIGQDSAINIIKKAGQQKRHILLIGSPGTGKSMLGQALAELLPQEKLQDVLILHNEQDENNPLVKTMPKSKGKELVERYKLQILSSTKNQNILFFILLILAIISPWWIRKEYGDIMAAATLITSMFAVIGFVLFINLNKRMQNVKFKIPKLLVDNSEKTHAPFLDASGAHAGALLGDVLHDPLQSFSLLNSGYINKEKKTLDKVVNKILKESENIKKDNYIAAFTKPKKYFTLGFNKKIKESEVLSVNKYKFNGNLIKLTTKSGKFLIVTPEHKVAIKNWLGKIIYKRADKIKPWHKLVTLN